MFSKRLIMMLGSGIFVIAMTLVLTLTLVNKKFRVTFDSLGGTNHEELILSKGDEIVLPTPEKEGYFFIEWYYLEGETEIIFTEDTQISKNITLYARWQILTYRIDFNSNGGTWVSVVINDFFVVPEEPDIPEKLGYVFEGWYLDENLTVLFDFSSIPDEDLTLYAKWEPIYYQINYILNGGENNPNNLATYTIESGTINLEEPSRSGYSFLGWHEDEDFSLGAIASFSSNSLTDVNLYAQWQINQYKIFDGSNNQVLFELDYNETIPDFNIPLKFGYDFLGYYLDEEFSQLFNYIEMPAEDLIVYPRFEPTVYSITYHLDGGVNSLNNPSNFTVEDGEIILEEPTKTGYTFKGWFLDQSFSGLAITSLNFNSLLDRNLYAKWELNLYSIEFVTNGGSALEELGVYYDFDIPLFPETAKEGYTFVGWFIDELFENEFNYQTMPAENLILFAKWEINQYRIDYYRFESDAEYFAAYFELDETVNNIFSGIYSTVFLTTDNRIFVSGRNQGYGASAWSSTPVDMTAWFNLEEDEYIIKVDCATANMAALTNIGRVFTWGQNTYGQLGDGTTLDKDKPVDITDNFNLNENEKIKLLSIGLNHGVVITNENRIFTWGRNNYSQLGDNSTNDSLLPININTLVFLNPGEEIVEVDSGLFHNGFVTSEQRVFTWGRNQYGQLGNNTTSIGAFPQAMTGLLNLGIEEEVIKISMDGDSSGILTSLGRVIVFGTNQSGQLGEYTAGNYLSPSDVTSRFGLETEDKMIDISIGLSHSIFLTDTGKVFVVGSNFYGQFGNETSSADITLAPLEITSFINLKANDKIIAIARGAYHNHLLTEQAMVIGFGYNEYGQLGDGYSSNRLSPIVLPFKLLVYLDHTDFFNYNEEISLYEFERPGYYFLGWKIDKEQTTNFNYTLMPANDLIVYDSWNLIFYTIHYHLNGGLNTVYNPYGFNVESDEIQLRDPTKENHVFGGWYDNEDFLGERIYVIPSGTIGDIHLYALWISVIDNVEAQMVQVGELETTYTMPTGFNDSQTADIDGGYYIAATETTYETWYWVTIWALDNGYDFQNLGTEGYYGVEGEAPTTSDQPVVNISWRDTVVWLNAFSEMSGLNPVYRTGSDEIIKDSRDANAVLVDNAIQTNNNGYRLPKALEWEMAARWTNDEESVNGSILVGGRYWTPGNYASGSISNLRTDFLDVAWYYHSIPYGGPYIAMPVRGKLPNALGLYDMSGNVDEMCFDLGSRSNTRITKGGSVQTQMDSQISVSYELSSSVVTGGYGNTGFRIVRNG